jgi:hypothetical protein
MPGALNEWKRHQPASELADKIRVTLTALFGMFPEFKKEISVRDVRNLQHQGLVREPARDSAVAELATDARQVPGTELIPVPLDQHMPPSESSAAPIGIRSTHLSDLNQTVGLDPIGKSQPTA